MVSCYAAIVVWLLIITTTSMISVLLYETKGVPQAIMTNQVFLARELQLQIQFVLRIEILKEFFNKKTIT